ncbi:MAG: hypothetical protein E6507_09720 [Prevotella bivia]|nr:hypothetical protein [Prevotella bivia]
MAKGFQKNSMEKLLSGLTSTVEADEIQQAASIAIIDKNAEISTTENSEPLNKKGSTSKERISTLVNRTLMDKIRTIAINNDVPITDIIGTGIELVVGRYEKKYGEIIPIKKAKKDFRNIL